MFGLNKITLGVMVALALWAVGATWALNRANVTLGVAQEQVRGRDDIIKGLQDAQISSNDIASLAANACRSSIQVQVRHQNEAQTIRRDGASAYDRLMCQRPEAAGHPKCAAAG